MIHTNRFTANFSGNAGRNRGLFAVSLGTLFLGCGCLPIVFSVLSTRADPPVPPVPHLSRTARLACIPVLWLGFLALLAGLQGVCILIFLFGDVRQLHAYELSKPKISSPLNPRPQAVRLGIRRRASVSGGLEEGTFGGGGGRGRSASLVYGKGGEIDMGMDMDMDDDGHSIMLQLKAGTLAATASESGISLDKLQDIPGSTPAPLHASPPNPNANVHANANEHTRARISVDTTQRRREGSVEITLVRTVEEDVYGIDAAPMSDTTIVVEHTSYAPAPTTTTTPTTTPSANFFGFGKGQQQHGEYKPEADADAAPYRFDFDALPLPAGMTLPPWPQTLRAPHPPSIAARRVGMMGMGMGRGLAERRLFAPLTKVLSPLVSRAQWVIIVRSALIALVLACTVGGASMAIR